jgi:hypothetical protein
MKTMIIVTVGDLSNGISADEKMVNKWTAVVKKGLKGDSVIGLPSYVGVNLLEYDEDSIKVIGQKAK